MVCCLESGMIVESQNHIDPTTYMTYSEDITSYADFSLLGEVPVLAYLKLNWYGEHGQYDAFQSLPRFDMRHLDIRM